MYEVPKDVEQSIQDNIKRRVFEAEADGYLAPPYFIRRKWLEEERNAYLVQARAIDELPTYTAPKLRLVYANATEFLRHGDYYFVYSAPENTDGSYWIAPGSAHPMINEEVPGLTYDDECGYRVEFVKDLYRAPEVINNQDSDPYMMPYTQLKGRIAVAGTMFNESAVLCSRGDQQQFIGLGDGWQV